MQLTGVPASPGVAAARAVSWDAAADREAPPAADLAAASARVAGELDSRASAAMSAEGRAVLEALAMFAADPGLLAEAARLERAGIAPTQAIRQAAAGFADQLRGLGGTFAERAGDVADVAERLAEQLEGQARAALPDPGHPYVLVCRDLAPAEAALVDPATVVGIVTEHGGPTSHTSILARSLGIPAIVGCADAQARAADHDVVLDGTAGQLHVDPPSDLADRLVAEAERIAERQARRSGRGVTADGTAVPLLVNVGTVDDAVAAAALDVEGIGLFRTEVCFLTRTDEPSDDEQVETYAAVLAAFGQRRVVVRTLDAGSDKPLPFLELPTEANPALGVRGVRVYGQRPDVLRRQLAALAAAAERTGTQPWVMAPMVATVAEAREFAAQARSAGLGQAGVMVEVPAAALRSRQLLAEVDFASIGTNDLGQYALAADRAHGELGVLLDQWQPALLDLVAATCAGARELDVPVGVCGEAAADPLLAAVLVGLGVRSLSMAPFAVPVVRDLLAEVDLVDCERAAQAACDASSAAEARDKATFLLPT